MTKRKIRKVAGKLYQAARNTFQEGLDFLSPTYRQSQGKKQRLTYRKIYEEYWPVQDCIDALAFWTCKEGFDTVLEVGPNAPKFDDSEARDKWLQNNFGDLKIYIDTVNRRVNLDERLENMIVKSEWSGIGAFYIQFFKDKSESKPWAFGNMPYRLRSLRPENLDPKVDKDTWELTHWKYEGYRGKLKPEKILALIRSDQDDDYQGLSSIAAIHDEIEIDKKIIREDLAEAVTTIWTGIIQHKLNTKEIKPPATEAKVKQIIQDHMKRVKEGAGKHIFTTDEWTVQIIDLKPDLDKLTNTSEKVQRSVVGHYKVPRFILNIEKDLNRATAEKELEAFVDGPIKALQRRIKRAIESQWYDRLTKQFYARNPEKTKQVRVVHKWRTIRTADWYKLIEVVSKAHAQGSGWASTKKAYEMMRDGKSSTFDPAEVEEEFTAA